MNKWLAEQVVPTRKKLVPGMHGHLRWSFQAEVLKARGPAASVSAPPWKVPAVGRDTAIANCKEYLAMSGDLQGRLRGLSGKTMVCHCGDLDRCHADTIIEAFELVVAKHDKVASDSSVEDLDLGNEGPPHKLGDGPVGKGPPLRVCREGERRDIVDGGGPCSPGMCRFVKGGSLTRRQCGAYGKPGGFCREVRARCRTSRSGWT